MPTINVLNMDGKVCGSMELSDAVFGAEVNKGVLHTVVRAYLLNQRQGTQSALTRAEVSGGGKKPWRQKGTGRARQGSTRSPQWRHGGIVFAPKPRLYKTEVNKKVKRLAFISALSAKTAGSELIVVDDISLNEYKTKSMVSFLKAVGAEGKALVVTEISKPTVYRSAGNIPGVTTAPVNALNVYDILKHDKLVISKAAVEKLQEVYA